MEFSSTSGRISLGPRSRGRGRLDLADLSNFKYNPADHPHLSKELQDWLSCADRFLKAVRQLDKLFLRRELIRRRLANRGGGKKHAIERPQARDIVRYARLALQLPEYQGYEVC
ncbi:hypothetical protein COCOBI_08-0910 [Coccomyxa sp. Obi]|nr:hypothetical protein COCOBI_08-0910 [Coccomyxa sp. Obi]